MGYYGLCNRHLDLSGLEMRGVTVIDEIGRRLARQGWVPAEWDEDDSVAFTRRHSTDISFELGLSVTPRNWGLSLNPTLGVRHAAVDRLSAEFVGVPPGACMTGTTLLDLLWNAQPRDGIGERWMVDRGADHEAEAAVADRVVADLHVYGKPFLAARASLTAVIAEMSAVDRTQLDDAYLAVGYALTGDIARAQQALADVATKAETEPLMVRDESDRFIQRCRAHFGLG